MKMLGFRESQTIGQFLTTAAVVAAIYPTTASGDTRCDTAFSRIAAGLARKALDDHRESICSGLKSGAFAIDKTKRLELIEAKVCENGLVVSAEFAVAIKCGTSDSAAFKVNKEDLIHATASVDFQHCTVLQASIAADSFLGSIGIASADVNNKLRAAIEDQVRAICIP